MTAGIENDGTPQTASRPDRGTPLHPSLAPVAARNQPHAVLVTAAGLFIAACGSLWHYLGALLHPNALTYSHAFFMQDILPTYGAARQIMAGHGVSMYDPAIVHGYTYSPVFAVLFIPVALLPWAAAQLVWYGLCQVWLWLAIGALTRLLSLLLPASLSTWRVWRIPVIPALAAVWLALAPSIQASLDFGQVDYLILALMALGLVNILRGRDVWGALFICLAALLKITPLGLIALFLLARRWRGLVAFAVTLAGSVAITALIPAIGPHTWVAMRSGVDANLKFIFGQYANESLGSIASHLLAIVNVPLGPHSGEYLGLGIAICLFVPVAFIAWRWPVDSDLRFGTLVACGAGAILLASPLDWDHSFVLAGVPAAALLSCVVREYSTTGVFRARHLAGVVCAAIIASWPSSAGLMADPQTGTARRLGDVALLAARPLALVAIVCLLIWYLVYPSIRPAQPAREHSLALAIESTDGEPAASAANRLSGSSATLSQSSTHP